MQSSYLPWLGYFELIYNCDIFILLDDVQYTKKDWRSRNRIRTKDGWMWLSVPVFTKGKRQQLINEAKINYSEGWTRKHLNSISINYQKSKYFKEYFFELQEIYKRHLEYLAELDIEIIIWLCKKLGIATSLIRSSTLKTTGRREEKIINICKELGAEELYDSKAARSILDIRIFQDAKIKIEFQDYIHPVYRQVYKPFVPYMSAIDLLFQYGPESLDILLGRKMAQIQ